MSSRKWVIKCKECGTECVYAEITSEGTANYFFPKKPELPKGFMFDCPKCGRKNRYSRTDLVYQDDALTRSPATTKCT